MKLTATRHEWTSQPSWALRLKRERIGSVWNDRGAWGWRVRGTEECYYADTREAACADLIAACGIDATLPKVWP